MIDLSALKKKRVLVTGHNSFVGATVCLWLSQYTHNITGFSLYKPTSPCYYDMLELKDSVIQHKNADIRQYESIREAVKESDPEIVIDLAAKTLVLESYYDSINYYKTNVMGRVNLLEAIKQEGHNVKAVSIITTDKVYSNVGTALAYKEEDRLGGRDHYSSSKAGAELVASAYRDSFFREKGISINTLRAGNILGLDFADNRIIPNLVRVLKKEKMKEVPWQAFKSNKKILLKEQAVRPWQHVNDIALGYLMLTSKAYKNPAEYSESWNFSPNYESIRTVKELVSCFVKIWYDDPNYDIGKISEPYTSKTEPKHPEDKTLILDSIKARIRLGWKNHYNFDEMVGSVAGMYKAYYNKQDMNQYALEELKQYHAKTMIK